MGIIVLEGLSGLLKQRSTNMAWQMLVAMTTRPVSCLNAGGQDAWVHLDDPGYGYEGLDRVNLRVIERRRIAELRLKLKTTVVWAWLDCGSWMTFGGPKVDHHEC